MPARDAKSDQLATPTMLPAIPSQEQPMHLEPAMENTTEPYVTRSRRQEVAPNQLDLYFILFIYYRLTPLEYKQIINDIKINGNCRRKLWRQPKAQMHHTRDAPSN